jgi:hypothetical protein
MTIDNLIDFEKDNLIYLIINEKIDKGKIYQILDIECETIGSRAFGHHNIYYAFIKDIVSDNVSRTMLINIDLLTERSEVYAVKVELV